MAKNKRTDDYSGEGFAIANRNSQLPNKVATHLREQILSGKLKQGQFLRIDTIAKQLGVSMTPVREGLLLLQSESFVQLIPRRGFVVNAFDKQDLRDLFWAQAMVGAELASRAASRMSKEGVEQLEKLHAEFEKAVAQGDREREARLGHEFHRRINLAARSTHLALLLGGLTKRLPNLFYNRIEGQVSDAAEYHPLILRAIRNRDAKSAASLMFTHIDSGGQHLVTMLEHQGIWDNSREAETDASKESAAVAKEA